MRLPHPIKINMRWWSSASIQIAMVVNELLAWAAVLDLPGDNAELLRRVAKLEKELAQVKPELAQLKQAVERLTAFKVEMRPGPPVDR